MLNCPNQETGETSTPTRPVENVVLTTKGLQERNTQLLNGTTVEKLVKKLINSNWNLPIGAWNMIFKSVDNKKVHNVSKYFMVACNYMNIWIMLWKLNCIVGSAISLYVLMSWTTVHLFVYIFIAYFTARQRQSSVLEGLILTIWSLRNVLNQLFKSSRPVWQPWNLCLV